MRSVVKSDSRSSHTAGGREEGFGWAHELFKGKRRQNFCHPTVHKKCSTPDVEVDFVEVLGRFVERLVGKTGLLGESFGVRSGLRRLFSIKRFRF